MRICALLDQTRLFLVLVGPAINIGYVLRQRVGLGLVGWLVSDSTSRTMSSSGRLEQ
jgi:hypothetical protein